MFDTLKIDEELYLKAADEKDAELIFQLSDKNRDFLQPWMQWIDKTLKVDDTLAFLRSRPMKSVFDTQFPIEIFYRGKLVGMTGFNNGNRELNALDLGYWISQEFQGKGIITRSVKALIRHAIEKEEIHRIRLIIVENNIASIKIARNIGFIKEGLMRDYFFRDGEYTSAYLYSFLKSDYENSIDSF